MQTRAQTVASVAAASTFNERVQRIRGVPAHHGTDDQAAIYADLASQLYVPLLAPDFAYVHWREGYELDELAPVYDRLHAATQGFSGVSEDELTAVLIEDCAALRVLRLITGLTTQEFAAATALHAEDLSVAPMSNSRVKSLEAGKVRKPETHARLAARTVGNIMTDTLFPAPDPPLRPKVDKPDTVNGWDTVRAFASNGVPYATFLHQRHYGGAFRQLLDATSSQRGDVLESAVEITFLEAGLLPERWVRTGAGGQQRAFAEQYGLTVKQAPDFFIFDASGQLRAMIECKGANDGGTARDKAARFANLRQIGRQQGGVPVFAVLSGLGWRRVNDTLGPVVRDTDGRVFTLANMAEMLTVAPFPELVANWTIVHQSPGVSPP